MCATHEQVLTSMKEWYIQTRNQGTFKYIRVHSDISGQSVAQFVWEFQHYEGAFAATTYPLYNIRRVQQPATAAMHVHVSRETDSSRNL